jgi:hypothetical protein
VRLGVVPEVRAVATGEVIEPVARVTGTAEVDGRVNMDAVWLIIPLGMKADLVGRRAWDGGGVRMGGGLYAVMFL